MSTGIISVKIGGYAGQGVKSTGLILAKLAVRSGYHIYDHVEFPSLIKGGHNVMQVNFSTKEVLAPQKLSDILIALNQETVDKYISELKAKGRVIYNSDTKINTPKNNGAVFFGVPLSSIAKEIKSDELLINTAALGATISMMGGNFAILEQLLIEEFGKNSKEMGELNIRAAKGGYDYVTEKYSKEIGKCLAPIENVNSFVPNMILTGTEASALGAIAGGLEFSAIYPMSPVSNILHVLASNQEKYGYIFKQPEDEISAINMCIGASYAGARSLTTTSGGGFCLMTEGYGLAGMTETPVVIVIGMRGAPATGLPTWSEQGDLQFVLHAHQGEFPRIVLAAGDAKESFDLTRQALNIADKYQTPVVVLLDKNICENDQSYPLFDNSAFKIERGKVLDKTVEGYKRYQLSENGVSERSIPGTGNFLIANSDEHDETGYSTEEIDIRNKMMEKRMQKLTTCEKEDMEGPVLYGPENADITLVSWGSNKGSILQALDNHPNVNYLHITWMNPFPGEKVKELLSKAKHVVDVECNYTGQLANLIREKTGIEISDKFLKYDGRQIFPEEIEEKISGVEKNL